MGDGAILIALISALTSSGLMSLVIFLITRRDSKQNKKSSEVQLLLAIAHDRIISLADYYIKRNAITIREKANLDYLYKPYSSAGGNGDGKIRYLACQELKIISEQEADEIDTAMNCDRCWTKFGGGN